MAPDLVVVKGVRQEMSRPEVLCFVVEMRLKAEGGKRKMMVAVVVVDQAQYAYAGRQTER